MTKRFEAWDDWDLFTPGVNTSGWTVRVGAPTYQPVYSVPGIFPFKERYLSIKDAAGATGVISCDAIDADANRAKFDVVVAFFSSTVSPSTGYIYARGQANTDWCRLAIKPGVAMTIDESVASAASTIGTGSTSPANNTAYLVRFRGNGTTVQARIWLASLGRAGEPSTWDITATTATTAAGYIGLGRYHPSSNAQPFNFNFFATGTNGDSAVCPRMDWEYETELGIPGVAWAVTCALRATGYDSAGSPFTKKVKAQISNVGYNAHEQDGLANPHFMAAIAQVPTFSVDLPGAFTGGGNVSVGEMSVRNPGVKADPRQNLLMYSIYNAARWTDPFGFVTFTGGQADPMGGADAVKCDLTTGGASNSLVRITPGYTLTAQGSYTLSFWAYLVSGTPGSISCDVADVAGSLTSFGGQLVTGQWVQITCAPAMFATATTLTHVDIINDTAASIEVLIYGVHLRQTVRDPRYVRTAGAAYDPPQVRKGLRDDWLRYAWDRDGLIMRLGRKDWPLHDHRVVLRGRVETPKAPTPSRITFRLADLSDVLNQDINGTLFTSGDYNNQRKPELFGEVAMMEPPMTDSTNLVLQISRRALQAGVAGAQDTGTAYSAGIPLFAAGNPTVSSIDIALDEITLSANHGMVVGSIMQFFSGPLPTVSGAALAVNTDLFVVSVPALNKVKLSRMLGGAAIDFTSNTAGALVQGFNWRIDTSAGTLTLVNAAGGRVTAFARDAGGSKLGQVYAAMFFDALALNLNMKDQPGFDALDASYANVTAGLWVGTEKTSALESANKFASGTFSWFVPLPDGRITVGRIGLPAATALATVTEADIKPGSMQLLDVIRPIDMSKAQVTYSPFFLTQGFLTMPPGTSPAILQNKAFAAPYSYGATSTPLENYPTVLDSNKNAVFETLLTGGITELRDYLATFYKWKLGIFGIQMKLRGITFRLGGTYRIRHGRLGWEVYSAANPSSPDNTTALDSELAVLVGKSFDLRKPFPISCKFMRPMHANFPTSDITT